MAARSRELTEPASGRPEEQEIAGLEPLAPLPSLDDHVHDALFEAILCGRLAPGTPLVEASVAEQLGVSKTPVRAALQRLEGELLARRSSSHRYCVTGFSSQDVRDIFLVRARLEGLAAFLATPHMTPEDFERASSLMDAAEKALEEGDIPLCANLGRKLHRLFSSKVENHYLLDSLRRLDAHVERGRRLASLSDLISRHSLHQHRLVLEAMRSGNASLAEQRMRDHVVDFIEEIQKTDEST